MVVDALINPRCAAVIRATARLARELGLALTGEGVETCEQYELLRSAGCDETQGYFHSRPLPESELSTRIRSRLPAAATAAPIAGSVRGAAATASSIVDACRSPCENARGQTARSRAMGDTVAIPKTKTVVKTERPRLHKVILFNDDYTPREFVVTC